jgi:hypothetical protein
VPALTGPAGGEAVRRFYAGDFIGRTPTDATLRPVACTVSGDRVIDEFVLEFTHDGEIPFMLPVPGAGASQSSQSFNPPQVCGR